MTESMKQSLMKLLCGASSPSSLDSVRSAMVDEDEACYGAKRQLFRRERRRRHSLESVSSSEYSTEEDECSSIDYYSTPSSSTCNIVRRSSRAGSPPSSISSSPPRRQVREHLPVTSSHGLTVPGVLQCSSSSSRVSASSSRLTLKSLQGSCSTLKSTMSSPRLLKRITRGHSIKHLKVLVLGQTAVGKTALTVRFVTRRFIGEYDPTLEQKYTFPTEIDGEQVNYEIFDTAGQSEDSPLQMGLQENIRWADAYILVYSVTDRCSFNEVTRLRFLINHCRRARRTGNASSSASSAFPVIVVGNKNDMERDRMVSYEEGQKLADDLGCARFHEISVRESHQEVRDLFEDVYFLHRANRKSGKTLSPPKLTRGMSIGGLGCSEDRSGSDSDATTTSTSTTTTTRTTLTSGMTSLKLPDMVRRKASIPRRLMQRVFKQDSMFKQDSINDSLKEDSSLDSS